MTEPGPPAETPPGADNAFEKSRHEQQPSLPMEFLLFLRDNKKWWLTPILLVLALMTAMIYFSASGAAPFIYSLF